MMRTPLRVGTRLATLMLCSLFLSLVFVACGGTNPTTSVPTPTPTPTPTTPASNLQNYPGADFQIGYPTGWKVTPGTNEVQFLHPNGNTIAIVEAPDLGGNTTGDTLAAAALQAVQQSFTNTQDDGAAPTVQLGGENWNQKQLDGDASDGTRATILILSTLHQPSGGATKGYFLLFASPKADFDTDLTTYFQPMASSFKFT